MSQCLDLVLKYKWYDMYIAGIKLEEYRDITPYWTKRISRSIKWVRFHRGYTSTTISFAVREVVIDTGNPEWGADAGKLYYVIRLGEKLI